MTFRLNDFTGQAVYLDTMIRYQLRPRCALHLAAMQRIGRFDLASNDAHFDRIPSIRRYAT